MRMNMNESDCLNLSHKIFINLFWEKYVADLGRAHPPAANDDSG